jgi:hypothetical protein
MEFGMMEPRDWVIARTQLFLDLYKQAPQHRRMEQINNCSVTVGALKHGGNRGLSGR